MPSRVSGRSCRQIEARTHPDFFVIEPDPEQATQQIKIEQVREIEHQIMYRPLIGERKICLIDNADRMTIGAANALLKTLEEPPAHSLFLVISSRPAALPATIRSRCRQVGLVTPPAAAVAEVLIRRDGIDPAASLLQAYTRVLAEAKPRFFILENVYALTFNNKASKPAFERLLREIDAAGSSPDCRPNRGI